jgi:predicted helicase
VKALVERYNKSISELKAGGTYGTDFKWTRKLKRSAASATVLSFDATYERQGLYRPYCRAVVYFSRELNEDWYRLESVFPTPKAENVAITVTEAGSQKPFMALATVGVFDYHLTGAATAANSLPLFRYSSSGERLDNITDWALDQFKKQYTQGRGKAARPISKEAIFHYVYAVLHDPVYREKYALNLKREFPRIPFYADFWRWADWGKALMELHVGYETVTPFKLKRLDVPDEKAKAAGQAPNALLKADMDAGSIRLDSATTLTGVPPLAWTYKLGNRSALEWVLDQHKEKTPKDPTIREKFNAYRFADHKEKVVDLLTRVTTVSVGTMTIVNAMAEAPR